MTSKNISLKKSAYEKLASLKREGESFSDLVNRLAREQAFTYADLAETLSKDTVQAIREAREERKKKDKAKMREIADRFKERP